MSDVQQTENFNFPAFLIYFRTAKIMMDFYGPGDRWVYHYINGHICSKHDVSFKTANLPNTFAKLATLNNDNYLAWER